MASHAETFRNGKMRPPIAVSAILATWLTTADLPMTHAQDTSSQTTKKTTRKIPERKLPIHKSSISVIQGRLNEKPVGTSAKPEDPFQIVDQAIQQELDAKRKLLPRLHTLKDEISTLQGHDASLRHFRDLLKVLTEPAANRKGGSVYTDLFEKGSAKFPAKTKEECAEVLVRLKAEYERFDFRAELKRLQELKSSATVGDEIDGLIHDVEENIKRLEVIQQQLRALQIVPPAFPAQQPPPEKPKRPFINIGDVHIDASINVTQKVQPGHSVKEEITPQVHEQKVTVFEEPPDFLEDVPEGWRWVFDSNGLAPIDYDRFETHVDSDLIVPPNGFTFYSLGEGRIIINGVKEALKFKGTEGTVNHVIILGAKGQNTRTHNFLDAGANVVAERNHTSDDEAAGIPPRSVSSRWYSAQIRQAGQPPNGGHEGKGAHTIYLHIFDCEKSTTPSGRTFNEYVVFEIPTGKEK